jgi:2-octaprenyl-6-methoxyphenol hydroxylase
MARGRDEIFDVAIVGGGLAGLALARALSHAGRGGARVALIDRSSLGADGSGGDPRASALTAASRNLFEALGVWPAIAPFAAPMVAVDVTDSLLDDGYRPVLLSFESILPSGEPGAFVVENDALRRALVDGCDALPGLTTFARADVASVELGGRRPVVRLADGRSIAARLLVAADGRRSPVRAAAGFRTIDWSYDQTAIVATVAHERPHEGRAIQHFLPAGPFAILPLTGTRSSLVWTESRREAAALMAADDATFLAALTRRFGHQYGALSLAGPRAAHDLSFSLARAIAGRRVALIGDAARAVHPLAGQGLNIGLKDVAALTECVVDAQALGLDPGADEALDRYARWRRFDAGASALGMDAMNRLFSNGSRPLRAARDFGLGAVDRMVLLKRMLIGEAAGLTGEAPRLLRG